MTNKGTPRARFVARRKELTTAVKSHSRAAHDEKQHHKRVRHIVECGKALTRLKELLGHGSWNQWLEDKCGINRMTANRYMRLAARKEVVERSMSIREAYIAAGVIVPKRAPARRRRRA